MLSCFIFRTGASVSCNALGHWPQCGDASPTCVKTVPFPQQDTAAAASMGYWCLSLTERKHRQVPVPILPHHVLHDSAILAWWFVSGSWCPPCQRYFWKIRKSKLWNACSPCWERIHKLLWSQRPALHRSCRKMYCLMKLSLQHSQYYWRVWFCVHSMNAAMLVEPSSGYVIN